MLAIRSLMFGSFSMAGSVFVLSLGAVVVFALDDRYWVLCPFLSTSGISVPGLPFNGTELGCLVLIGTYVVRLSLKKCPPFRVNCDLLVLFPVLGWIFVVWMLNPVGLAMFGTSVIGGRFYFEIAVGFVSLLILSSFRFEEVDARLLFWSVFAAQCWLLMRGVVFPAADPDAIVFSVLIIVLLVKPTGILGKKIMEKV